MVIAWNDNSFYDDSRYVQVEVRFDTGDTLECGDWTLTIENDRERTIHLEATMNTRLTPVPVCGVSLDGEPLPVDAWSFDETTSILEATYTTTSGALLVSGC